MLEVIVVRRIEQFIIVFGLWDRVMEAISVMLVKKGMRLLVLRLVVRVLRWIGIVGACLVGLMGVIIAGIVIIGITLIVLWGGVLGIL